MTSSFYAEYVIAYLPLNIIREAVARELIPERPTSELTAQIMIANLNLTMVSDSTVPVPTATPLVGVASAGARPPVQSTSGSDHATLPDNDNEILSFEDENEGESTSPLIIPTQHPNFASDAPSTSAQVRPITWIAPSWNFNELTDLVDQTENADEPAENANEPTELTSSDATPVELWVSRKSLCSFCAKGNTYLSNHRPTVSHSSCRFLAYRSVRRLFRELLV